MSINPPSALPNTPTQFTVTAAIPDTTTLIPGSVNLQVLDSSGDPVSVIGLLYDDGQSGDSTAGDKVFTIVFTRTQATVEPLSLRVSAAFAGVLERVVSTKLTVFFGAIGYGSVVTGGIAVIGEEDKYGFMGAVGDRVFTRMTSAFLPRVRVLRPNGTQLCVIDNALANNLQLECVLDSVGLHNVVVTDRNVTQVGAYTFTLNRLNPPVNANPISYGQVVSGTHDPIAELDFHTFTGAVGERIWVRLTGAFRPQVRVLRPNGTELCYGDNNFDNHMELECVVAEAGLHSVVVTDRNMTQVGAYAFTLNRLNAPVNANPISYGQVVPGTHNPAVELDFHTFPGAVGERIWVRLSGAFRPQVRVRKPNGTELCFGDSNVDNHLELECLVADAGLHTVVVTDRNRDQVGTYAFTLNRLNPPVTSNAISYGQVVSGTHDPSTELDFHTFTGAVGERIWVRLTGAFRPQVRVRKPNGTELCFGDSNSDNHMELECVLDTAGVHSLLVADRNRDQVGAYTFTLNRFNPPVTANPITYGQVVSGTHDPSTELDFHTFTGAVGERIWIRLTSAFRPQVRVRKPNGTEVCFGDSNVDNHLELECLVADPGLHTVVVTDRNRDQVGGYTFTLNRLNPPVTANVISYGQVVSGTHDPSTELDFHTFTGAVGERIWIRLTGAFRPQVRVRKPNGTELCFGDSNSDNHMELECVLDTVGVHSLLVADRNRTETGAYTFTLNRLNPPANANPISYGQTVSGTHNPIAELDFHTFTGAVGEKVRINITSTFLPLVRIRRPDGTELCSADNASSGSLERECTLDRAGTHAIAITDRNRSQIGTYDLTLTLIP